MPPVSEENPNQGNDAGSPRGLKFWIMFLFACVPFMFDYKIADNGTYVLLIDNPLETQKSFVLILGIFLIMAASHKAIQQMDKCKRSEKISAGLSVFFSLCLVFGKSYERTASWDLIFSSFSGFMLSLCIIAGYAIILYCFIRITINFIISYDFFILKNGSATQKFSDWFEKVLQKRSLLKIWVFLFVPWLIFATINYPGIIHADNGFMLGQFLNNRILNHHPVIQTIVWGNFVRFGVDVLGSSNVGVFLYVLIQITYGSLISALLFDYVYKKGYPAVIISVSLCIYAIAPLFIRSAVTVSKDSNYTFFVMLMIWLIFQTIDNLDKILKEKWYLALIWVFVIILVCFSRRNGIYVAFPTVLFLLLHLIKRMKAMKKQITLLCLAVFAGFGVYFLTAHIIDKNFDNDDTRETLSILFQQTARYIRDHGFNVADSEREAINAILDYDSLAALYNPEIIDPVKRTFKNDSTNSDLQKYFYVWFKQFFKHPTVYLQATLNLTYGYFYPDSVGYYKGKSLFYSTEVIDSEFISYPSDFAEKIRTWQTELRKLPIIGLLSSTAFYIWMNIFIVVFFVGFKDKKFLIYNIPSAMSLLICVAGPVCTVRYAMPIIFSVPIFFCMCFKEKPLTLHSLNNEHRLDGNIIKEHIKKYNITIKKLVFFTVAVCTIFLIRYMFNNKASNDTGNELWNKVINIESNVMTGIENIKDSNPATRWTTGRPQMEGDYLLFEFNESVDYTVIYLDNGKSSNDYPRDLYILTSDDAILWYEAEVNASGNKFYRFISEPYRYIKLENRGNDDKYWWSVHKIEFGY